MIEFAWDSRKARRNERVHHVSFPVAQAALESRLGVEIAEQFREGEWRTIVGAPFRGTLLLHITISSYTRGQNEDSTFRSDEAATQDWTGEYGTIRIISARKATAEEQALYIAARSQSMG